MNPNRRRFIMQSLFGAGYLGLRSVATGIPAAVFLQPERAFSQGSLALPQFLLMSSSANGDPVNANAPGMYDDAAIGHADHPLMQATPMTLGNGEVVKAAKVWTQLHPDLLQRTCFFHHGTYTVIHPDENKVLRLMGKALDNEMLPSLLAQETTGALGTIRSQPISLSGNVNETIYVKGAPQPLIRPTTMANVLGRPGNGLGSPDLLKVRDQSMDALNRWFKTKGNASQRAYIDQYALSRDQLRTLQEGLLENLAAIEDDSPLSQIRAAIVLFQMKVTPAVTIKIPFGGDNHGDEGLENELREHMEGVDTLNKMHEALLAAKLRDQVTFAMTNVFGRTLQNVSNGRNHNENHHVSLLIGSRVRGSQIGGIGNDGSGYKAMAIDSSTGKASASGDVGFYDGLSSMAKTLASALALPDPRIGEIIRNGSIIRAALN